MILFSFLRLFWGHMFRIISLNIIILHLNISSDDPVLILCKQVVWRIWRKQIGIWMSTGETWQETDRNRRHEGNCPRQANKLPFWYSPYNGHFLENLSNEFIGISKDSCRCRQLRRPSKAPWSSLVYNTWLKCNGGIQMEQRHTHTQKEENGMFDFHRTKTFWCLGC